MKKKDLEKTNGSLINETSMQKKRMMEQNEQFEKIFAVYIPDPSIIHVKQQLQRLTPNLDSSNDLSLIIEQFS